MDIGLNTDTDDIGTLDGDLFLTTADVAVAQELSLKLRLFKGEWFLGQQAGIPYHDEVFVKNPRMAVLDAKFKAEILAVEDVVELTRFDMSLDGTTRTLSLVFSVRTINGTILDFDEDLGSLEVTTGGNMNGVPVTVVFSSETEKQINVAAFGLNAQFCAVEVLNALNGYATEELTVTRPSASIIKLEAGLPITKTFRVIISQVPAE